MTDVVLPSFTDAVDGVTEAVAALEWLALALRGSSRDQCSLWAAHLAEDLKSLRLLAQAHSE